MDKEHGNGRRGRGGRGRGRAVTEADAPTTQSRHPSAPPATEEDVRVSIPGAFAVSFPDISRVKERGRAFVVRADGDHASTGPPTAAPRRVFLVAERTIAGVDDIVYEKHRAVWEYLPRGNARVFVVRGADASQRQTVEQPIVELVDSGDVKRMTQATLAVERSALVPVAAINGLRKFSYNDKPAESRKGDYGYEDEVDAVVALDKENGECGHISAFTLAQDHRGNEEAKEGGEERYWVIGSKNVHIVLPYHFTAADVTDTYKARRYGYAAKIALQWRDIMLLAERHSSGGAPPRACTTASKAASDAAGVDGRSLAMVTADGIRRFHALLATKNYTACFEAIFRDSQHLVDYKNRNEFRFFALTDNATYETSPASEAANSYVHGLCIDIQDAFKAFAGCGLPTAPIFYDEAGSGPVGNAGFATLHKVPYKSPAYHALVDAIGHRQNSEGCVMYGYKTRTEGGDACRVVKVWKEKAYPYVMERATREAIVNHKLAGKELEAKITKKLAMQKPHIRKYFAEWEQTRLPFLMIFSAYLQVTGQLTPFMTKDESFMAIRNHWLSLQHEFDAKMERDGELRTVCERFVPGETSCKIDDAAVGANGGPRTRDVLRLDVIKFVGAQGCGKSTMSRVLFFLLAEANHRPRWLNQDEAGNRNNYLAAIKKATQDARTVMDDAAEKAAAQEEGAPSPALSSSEGKITHLMLDKMNLDKHTNNDYRCLPEPAVTVFFTFENETDRDADYHENLRRHSNMTQLLLSRVVNRGSAHRTIKIPEHATGAEKQQETLKIKKFLSQAVRACEVPEDDDNLLVIDVTDTLENQVKKIWAALQENGFYEIPGIDTLHLSLAIDVATRYERLLTEQKRPPLYACLSVLPADNAKLLAVVDPACLVGKKVQSEFHVTTKYFGGDPDPLYLVALAELQGQRVDVVLAAVSADEKGVAIRVRNERTAPATPPAPTSVYDNDIIAYFVGQLDGGKTVPRRAFPCANAVAHITVANAPGIPAKYSNELLARDPGTPIAGSVSVKAVYEFR